MAREMRNSEKSWIGDIPKHWKLMRIKNIIQQSKEGIKIGPFGSALTNKTSGEGEYNVYSQANLIASDFSSTKNTIDEKTFVELQNYEVFPNDICLSMMGTIGKCKKVPVGIKRGIMDSHLIKIRLSENVESRYFEYVYDKDLGGVCFAQMQYDKKGFIMDGLNTSIVKNLYFPLPPINEQIQISDYLDTECARIDTVIEKTRASIEEYKKLKQSVITQAVTKGIRPKRKMRDSGIESYGFIPDNWDCCKLKYLISSLYSGSSVTATDLTEDGYPVYGGGQQIGFFSQYNMEDTIVVGRVGARCGCVTKVEGKAWATDNALIASTDFPIDYLYYILVAAELNKLNTSNAQPLITSGKVLNLKVPVCWDREEQKEITAYLDKKCLSLESLIDKKWRFASELEHFKRAVIFEYATGKKEVPNADYFS